MKPILLKLENFTTYKKLQEIDFSDLNFFIIQGRTGAGKTSIIDAMCYALYGKVPRYKGTSIHEHLLSKGQKRMRVYFEFSVKGKRYAVDRQYEPSKPPMVRFYEGSRLLNLKVREVEDYVSKLLGMDYETFTKVLVLPQGQFDRFLKPQRPAERREILNRLLGYDEIFERISSIIKETLKELEREKGILEAEYESLKSINQTMLEQKEKELKRKQEEFKSIRDQKERLSDELQKAIEKERLENELSQKTFQLSQLLNKHGEINQKKEKLEKAKRVIIYWPLVREYESILNQKDRIIKEKKELQHELVKYSEEIKSAQEEYEKIEEKYKKLDKMREKINLLEIKKEKLNNLESIKRKIYETNIEISKNREELQNISNSLTDLNEKLQQQNSYLSDLEEKLKNLEGIEAKYAKAQQLKPMYDSIPKIDADIKRIDKDIQQKEMELGEVQSKIRQLEEKLFEEYIHQIRLKLSPGDTCPVCGNKVKNVYMVSLEMRTSVENVKEEIQNLRQKERELVELLSEKRTQKNSLIQKKEEIISYTKLDFQEFQKRYKALEENYKTFLSLREKEKACREKLQKLKEEKSSKEVELSKLETSIKHSQRLLAQLQEEEERLLKEIGEPVIDPARSVRQLEDELKNLKEEINSIQKRYEEVSSYLKELSADLERIKVQMEEKERREEELKERLNQLAGELYPAFQEFGDLETLKSFYLPEDEIQKLDKEINNYERDMESLKRDISLLKERIAGYPKHISKEDLERKVKGLEEAMYRINEEIGFLSKEVMDIKQKIQRKEHIEKQLQNISRELWKYETLQRDMRSENFPEFVSRQMLQTITDRASFYLLKFSSGTYEFKLNEGDLLVIDRSSGHERSVFTLSGGETFLASLSLAFAVSDIVSHNAPLESIFIDEGFGNLDRETRESLGEFFELIKLNAGRMVGIISHLEDLAEKFDQRVLVEKHGDYSTVKVQVI